MFVNVASDFTYARHAGDLSGLTTLSGHEQGVAFSLTSHCAFHKRAPRWGSERPVCRNSCERRALYGENAHHVGDLSDRCSASLLTSREGSDRLRHRIFVNIALRIPQLRTALGSWSTSSSDLCERCDASELQRMPRISST